MPQQLRDVLISRSALQSHVSLLKKLTTMSSNPPDDSEETRDALDAADDPDSIHLPGGKPSTTHHPLSNLAPPQTPPSKVFSNLPTLEGPASRDILDATLQRVNALRGIIGTASPLRHATYQILTAFADVCSTSSPSHAVEECSLLLAAYKVYTAEFIVLLLRLALIDGDEEEVVAPSLLRKMWVERSKCGHVDEEPPIAFSPPPPPPPPSSDGPPIGRGVDRPRSTRAPRRQFSPDRSAYTAVRVTRLADWLSAWRQQSRRR